MTAKQYTNDRLLRALTLQPVDRTPVWMMRQAGRYLPEYQEVRKQAGDFLSLCRSPQLACEVSLQPVERYPLDAAIVFSDILVIPEAMGMDLQFTDTGPVFNNPLRSQKAIDHLDPLNVEKLAYVYDTIDLLVKSLAGKVPLIGFAGSPWTLATYMIEGKSSSAFTKIKTMMYQNPELLERLLDKLALAVSKHLYEQIRAGADCIMIFDTWGGVLAYYDYLRFSLEPMRRAVSELRNAGNNQPIILFTKGGSNWLEAMADSKVNALGLDWTVNIGQAKMRVGDKVALQGNLDPFVLFSDEATIRTETRKVLDDFGTGNGHIFNLGHGIYQQTDPEKVAVMIDEVHSQSCKS